MNIFATQLEESRKQIEALQAQIEEIDARNAEAVELEEKSRYILTEIESLIKGLTKYPDAIAQFKSEIDQAIAAASKMFNSEPDFDIHKRTFASSGEASAIAEQLKQHYQDIEVKGNDFIGYDAQGFLEEDLDAFIHQYKISASSEEVKDVANAAKLSYEAQQEAWLTDLSHRCDDPEQAIALVELMEEAVEQCEIIKPQTVRLTFKPAVRPLISEMLAEFQNNYIAKVKEYKVILTPPQGETKETLLAVGDDESAITMFEETFSLDSLKLKPGTTVTLSADGEVLKELTVESDERAATERVVFSETVEWHDEDQVLLVWFKFKKDATPWLKEYKGYSDAEVTIGQNNDKPEYKYVLAVERNLPGTDLMDWAKRQSLFDFTKPPEVTDEDNKPEEDSTSRHERKLESPIMAIKLASVVKGYYKQVNTEESVFIGRNPKDFSEEQLDETIDELTKGKFVWLSDQAGWDKQTNILYIWFKIKRTLKAWESHYEMQYEDTITLHQPNTSRKGFKYQLAVLRTAQKDHSEWMQQQGQYDFSKEPQEQDNTDNDDIQVELETQTYVCETKDQAMELCQALLGNDLIIDSKLTQDELGVEFSFPKANKKKVKTWLGKQDFLKSPQFYFQVTDGAGEDLIPLTECKTQERAIAQFNGFTQVTSATAVQLLDKDKNNIEGCQWQRPAPLQSVEESEEKQTETKWSNIKTKNDDEPIFTVSPTVKYCPSPEKPTLFVRFTTSDLAADWESYYREEGELCQVVQFSEAVESEYPELLLVQRNEKGKVGIDWITKQYQTFNFQQSVDENLEIIAF